MRLKPLAWLGLSLLLFAAALATWRYGNKYSALHAAHANRAITPRAPLVAGMATNVAPPQHKSYRLRNTTQTVAQLLHNKHALLLRNALIDTEVHVPLKVPEQLRAKGAPGSYIVQADRPLDNRFYKELKDTGVTYISYIPNNAALIKASPENATNLAAKADVIAVLPYEPYYKLDSTLLPAAADQQPSTHTNLSVTTFPGQRDAALAELTKLGAKLLGEDRSPFGPTLIVSAPATSLAAIAQMPLTQEIEAYTPRRTLNDLTRVRMNVATNTLIGTPNNFGLTGSNVMVNVNDTGVDITHPDFAPMGRVFGATVDNDGHGTHVAGIIAGNGSESTNILALPPGSATNADFRGQATNASLYVQRLGLVMSDADLQATASSNLGPTNLISNNSWGYTSSAYDIHAASFDAATRDAQPFVTGEQPLLFVFAAGNSGNGDDSGTDGADASILSPGTAKDVITVGASDSPRFLTNLVSYDGSSSNEVFFGATDNSNLVAWFSSCGNVSPGVEGTYGRFKPDVVAPGVFIVSCRSTNYVDPTNETYLTVTSYTNQIVKVNNTNIFPFYIPTDASGLYIVINSNAASPRPFPDMTLVGDNSYPPVDLLSTNNYFQLTNYNPGDVWFFGVTPPTNQPGPVNYDIDFYLYETNSEGNYYTTLSNMNSILRPYYRYESGTSMSAAAVSGTLALMQEYLQKNTPDTNPSPALMKALLINGSRSLGAQYDFDVNTTTANEQGWGLPSLTNCIPTNSTIMIDQSPSNSLSTGQYASYTVTSADTNTPIRITLVWTDPPGNPAAGVALVNNLELTVADSSGSNVFIGNDFGQGDIYTEVRNPTNLPSNSNDNVVLNTYVNNGVATYTTAGDPINNVQNVYINPAAIQLQFPLTITVSGTRVNVNAVPSQTNNIAQDFALVISSGDPANSLTVTTNAIVTSNPILITAATNGVPLLHERVGANEPNLYLTNSDLSATNGNFSQWHFFVFTNDQFSATNNATNVAFATFLPPNLSLPRNLDADIDMYVSTNPDLTNLLNPTNQLIAVQGAAKSLTRTGTESVIYSNSTAGQVYYIGVKSEDQQAADFGFYGIAQQNPFSTTSADGSTVTATGTALPVFIPNAISPQPALVFAFLVNPNPLFHMIRRITPTVGIAHPVPSDIYGTLQHNGITMVLNNYSGIPGGFTNTYDDLQESASSPVSDGPGSLTEFVGQQADGLWLLTEADNALAQTGYVTEYTISVDLQQPQTTGFLISIPANSWFDDYIDVPNDATNLIISALYESGSGPVGIYITNEPGPLSTSDYGSNVAPPGGSLTLGTNPPPFGPPLSGGTWYYGIYNGSGSAVTLYVQVQIQENIEPNLVQSFTNTVPIPLTTDGHTQTQFCIDNDQQLVNLQVGLRVDDTNLDDLVIHLISPQGTSVLLFENRGGTNAYGLGLTQTNATSTNIQYTVFTENTNLTDTPIKFAKPPYAFEQDIPLTVLTTNSFEDVPAGTYTNNNTNIVSLDGWIVTNNLVQIPTTNGIGYLTNNTVGIMTDPYVDTFDTNFPASNFLGTNFLALTSGRIVQTFSNLTVGAPYQLVYYARPDGITHWWPADNTTNDIIGTDNGTIPYSDVTYDAGEVGRAFTFSGTVPNPATGYQGNEVDFNNSAGNFGTNNFTVDFWIKQNATETNEQAIMEKRVQCGPAYAFWEIQVGGPVGWGTVLPGHLKSYIQPDGGASSVGELISQRTINDGIFHHVALVRTGPMYSYYIDGLLDSSNTASGAVAYLSNSANFRLGQSVCISNGIGTPDATRPFRGDLDEVDMFNRTLSPAEIYGIYHAGALGKYSTNSILPNFTETVDGFATNNIVLTNASGGWQLFTNTFIPTNSQVTIEFSGNPLGVLLDDIQLVQLPTTNYNNYFLPEEPLSTLIGENPKGCWTLDIWDTRVDSSQPVNGTLLGWTLQLTTSSTNAPLYILTNAEPVTNSFTNGIVYYAVDVPPTAHFATNIFTVQAGGGALTLLFNQDALPTGGLPGDMVLQGGAPGMVGTTTLDTVTSLPPLVPGRRYFLGVLNSSAMASTYTLEVDFDGVSNSIIALTNAMPYTNAIGTNTFGTNGPQYYSFTVPTNAVMVTFQLLNPDIGEVDLYASEGLPLPSPLMFDYQSRNSGTASQFIVVTTNSSPVSLPVYSTNNVSPQPTTWYLTAYNAAGLATIDYNIIATVVTTNDLNIIPLTNGMAFTNTALPGYPTNTLYSYTVTVQPPAIEFTVTNLTNYGNVELLSGLGIFPTPDEFYYGSFNPGTNTQVIILGTNSVLTNLDAIWYLAVPNTSNTNVPYAIMATNLPTSVLTNTPLVVGASVSKASGLFTMTWSATPGKTYEVDYSTNLTGWNFLSNVTPSGTSGTYTDPTPISTQKERFYRLKQN